VVYDNPGLLPFVKPSCRATARLIAYPGDHVLRPEGVLKRPHSTLTVCRIEPENQIEMIIEGVLASKSHTCRIAGNWEASKYGRDLRARYAGNDRVEMLDSVYDQVELSHLREACTVYIHAHSVGGTNPSLVEMMFYDCKIFCYDCGFNRESAGDCALYFSDSADLARLLDKDPKVNGARDLSRRLFTRTRIADLYVEAMTAAGLEVRSAKAEGRSAV
jgi:glycosyltransferase involved in cell wall biosynthesis